MHKGAYKNAAMVYVPPHPPHTCFSRSMRADQAGAFFMWAQSRACVLCLSHPFGLSRSSFLSFLFKTLRVSRVACGCALRLAQLLVRAGPAARQRGGGPRPGGGAQGHQVPHDVARRRAPPPPAPVHASSNGRDQEFNCAFWHETTQVCGTGPIPRPWDLRPVAPGFPVEFLTAPVRICMKCLHVSQKTADFGN